ncbi:MAG TPA: D-glycero-beta-D-manno-heptose 1,7-bisphosphate 7-phosphatase [Steroidobacteraceae bacterium]|jgi:D-glycero-D-manno-heptose 1,7-bisphosphate phosphatase|nr:D-glycero-beta-D-manno-heptose 1,7-bisphosphate 7-phosphatase [Steroidobacteraceae bacterium]
MRTAGPQPGRKAAFVDRDGVITVDSGFLHRVEDLVFLPGAIEGLQRLQAAHYLLVVITNQSGIARGFYTEADYLRLTGHMQQRLSAAGVQLSAVEYCPHLPDAQIARYRVDCDCRKPLPGMLRRAAAALNIDMASSVLVGDRAIDVQAGRSAGVGRCWLVRSGVALSPSDIELADAVFDDLAACARQLAD